MFIFQCILALRSTHSISNKDGSFVFTSFLKSRVLWLLSLNSMYSGWENKFNLEETLSYGDTSDAYLTECGFIIKYVVTTP